MMEIHDHLYERVSVEQPFLFEIWEPEGVAVVIGHGQNAVQEVDLAACRRDGVAVIRRRGGGGAVVLMPGVLCLSCAFLSGRSDSPYYFFQQINLFISDLLARRFSLQGLEPAGISDIALAGRKILGCSMFKSRRLYFYQGSLLLNPDLARITAYLTHPSREPGYRRGRTHSDFLTSLWQSGYPLPMTDLKEAFTQNAGELRSLLI